MADALTSSPWSGRAEPRAGLTGVPTLAELTPQRALELPAAIAAALLAPCDAELARVHGIRDVLLIRAASSGAPVGQQEPSAALPALLTITAAAARISVPASRIKAAIAAGKLQSQKVGHYRRIRPEWLEEFVRAEQRETD